MWGPSSSLSRAALNIQQVFTFANCLRQPTMKSVRISFPRQLNSLFLLLLLIILFLLFLVTFARLSLSLSSSFFNVSPARLDLVRLPFSRVHPSNRPGNYIWVLIKRTSWTRTARSWFSPLASTRGGTRGHTVTPSAVINLLETPG